MSDLLKEAYDPSRFREQGHAMVDVLADYLENAMHREEQAVFTPFKPDTLYEEQKKELNTTPGKRLEAWAQQLIQDSIHLHNPGYMGHQVSPVLPQAALVELLSALLNNGVGVYEMGSPTVAMERVVIKHLVKRIGFSDDADGVLTSGGTLGNLTALLTARQVKLPGNPWNSGTAGQTPGILVSEQAHYSIARAAKILGWGEAGIIKVPVDNQFRLNSAALDAKLKEAREHGINVLAVVGSACSTATGSFDPLPEIGAFCEKNDLWFHVDAAHGGGALYSPRYRSLLDGIEAADSVIIDFHKMMMCPALVTGVAFKDGRHSYQTFAQKAEYLWKQEGHEWYNLGKRTFECTKDMMALKVYSALHQYGPKLFTENNERLFDLARIFSGMIKNRARIELLIPPQGNIVCFRFVDKKASKEKLNALNEEVRRRLIERGRYFIVQTSINNEVFLRATLMNPFTAVEHLKGLLDEVEAIGAGI